MPGPAPKTPTRELLAEVCASILLGATASTAAAAAGVSRATWARWVAWGREGKPRYVEVAAAIDKAKAQFILEALRELRESDDKNSKKWMWLLERRAPFDYGDTRLVPEEAPEGEGAPPITIRIMGPGPAQ